MGKIKRYKNSIEKFLSGESGQRFFNFCYSIGAAIVIWGALFKILHLPGGNTLLCIGMGTEVLMFILTAFDRPPREYRWEDVFPVLESRNPDDRPGFGTGAQGGVVINGTIPADMADMAGEGSAQQVPHGARANGAQGPVTVSLAGMEASAGAPVAASPESMADLTLATQEYLSRMSEIATTMEQLRDTTAALNEVSRVLLDSYKAITDNSAGISSSSTGYVAQMEDLNRNIGGLNTIYEIQLKSVSSQLDSIDRVNRGIKDIRDMYEKSSAQSMRYYEETEKMARYMQQLNQVYEKMIHAMTVNMYRAPMPEAPAPAPQGAPAPATPEAPSSASTSL